MLENGSLCLLSIFRLRQKKPEATRQAEISVSFLPLLNLWYLKIKLA